MCHAKVAKPHAGAQQAGSSVSLPTPAGFSRRAQILQAQCLESRRFPFYWVTFQVQFARAWEGLAREQDPNPIRRWAPSCHDCSCRCHAWTCQLCFPLLGIPARPDPNQSRSGQKAAARCDLPSHPPTSDLWLHSAAQGHGWLLNPLADPAVLCSRGTQTSHCFFFFRDYCGQHSATTHANLVPTVTLTYLKQ